MNSYGSTSLHCIRAMTASPNSVADPPRRLRTPGQPKLCSKTPFPFSLRLLYLPGSYCINRAGLEFSIFLRPGCQDYKRTLPHSAPTASIAPFVPSGNYSLQHISTSNRSITGILFQKPNGAEENDREWKDLGSEINAETQATQDGTGL